MGELWFTLGDQPEKIKERMGQFATEGTIEGYISMEYKYIFGRVQEGYVLTNKAASAGWKDPKSLAVHWIETGKFTK